MIGHSGPVFSDTAPIEAQATAAIPSHAQTCSGRSRCRTSRVLPGWSSATSGILEDLAMVIVSPLRRGFAKGRQIVDSVFDVEAAMEESLHRTGCDPGVFLFDVEAAFPSASQDWISRVLESICLPLELRRSM